VSTVKSEPNRYTQKVQLKAAEQRRLLAELKELAVSVNRCENTITALMGELNSANAKYQGQRATQQEVEYLTILLACAKRKLAWEKQIASLQKRAPALLAEMTTTLNDQDFPPTDEMKAEMMHSLQIVQAALNRLQATSGGAG
jgi:chromosome segregation ATPase